MTERRYGQENGFVTGVKSEMIVLHRPELQELWFRRNYLSDPETMSYNNAWGGVIAFPENEWEGWYNHWLADHENKRFYRYLRETQTNAFVGEIAFHFDDAEEKWLADVIISSEYRKRGYGREGLRLLCEAAVKNGIHTLYDDIAIDNPAVRLFQSAGFTEEYRTSEIIMLKKELPIPGRKIMVIGCPGSGKSTFARKLRAKTGIPLYCLDMLFHNPDRTTVTRDVFDARLDTILKNEEWIIDGNYQRTLPLRFEKCTEVFFFDLPVDQCLKGAAARIGTKREDLPWVENEFDPEFRQYILDFPKDQLPRLNELAAQYRDIRKITVFHSWEEADAWLE